MDVSRARRGMTLGRLLLLALLAGVAWCALSLFASTSSASATPADNEPGSGLLGVVGETVSSVGGLVAETTGTVDQVVDTVATAAAPVPASLPAPVAQPVAAVVGAASQVAQQTVAQVDTSAAVVVDTATTTVEAAAAADTVSHVVAPVVDLAEALPVTGGIVAESGLGEALTDTADALDEAISTTVGSTEPVGPVLPELPVRGIDTIIDSLAPGTTPSLPGGVPSVPLLPVLGGPLLGAGGALPGGAPGGAPSYGAVHVGETPGLPAAAGLTARPGSPAAGPGSDGSTRSGVPGVLGAGAPGSTGAGAQGAGGSPAGLAHEDARHALHRFSFRRTTTDDALPGAPVFDTDVSPD